FLAPQTDMFSDAFIHLSFGKSSPVRALLELMVVEYADRKEDSQRILKPMVLSLFMHIARRWRQEKPKAAPESLFEKIVQHINSQPDSVTLTETAAHFGYHPNYISGLLHRKFGKTFSEIVLEKRMARAVILLKGTTLSIEEVAGMVGYSNHSNFYKAFRNYFGAAPREYLRGNG
ncbi:MAG: helix-turn-helix transcriptional regulator, partial [Deltaproteobacteria bacterium]|nr:helix-turn-helix transcriptional regulator [Deltaproteobacteria bacterium]